MKIKHSNLYICTSSAIKLNWLLLHKNAVQLLINTNKGFMYKTKTETICFTNRNCWKFLTNPWKISLPSAKLWPEKLKNNIGTSRIPVGRANGFSYQKTKQRTYILRTEVSWSYNALFLTQNLENFWWKMSNVPKFYNNLVGWIQFQFWFLTEIRLL